MPIADIAPPSASSDHAFLGNQVVRLSPARREVHISVVPGTQTPISLRYGNIGARPITTNSIVIITIVNIAMKTPMAGFMPLSHRREIIMGTRNT